MDSDDASVSSENGPASYGPKETIVVTVRMRPLNEREKASNDIADWECVSTNTIVYKNKLPERSLYPTAYTFDRVFGPECSTQHVYNDAAKETALSVVSGINSSIFAYGQTSSGKTYTMNGITHLAINDIYDYMDKHDDREFVLKFSAMEIYNEVVRDLLGSDTTPLRLLDDPERGTVVERLMEETVNDQSHLEELLSLCEAQRQIGETALNETSSRSHQILRLTIESSAREYVGGNSSTLTAYVDFVDLAGSERASQTLSAGARLKEGSHINRSLLTLGTVIRKLSKGTKTHIPYRDSKLTRILHNSLGGNAKTAIICTMSPARSHGDQSRNTLFFASCAKEVATNSQVNIVMSDKALVKQLQRELARVENELKSLVSASVTGDVSQKLKEKERLIEKMDREIKELTQQRDLAESRIEDLLRGSRKNEALKLDEALSESSNGGYHFPRHGGHRTRSSSQDFDDHQLQLPDYKEDNFLLDASTPRFSGLDSCSGWEEIAQRYRDPPDYICKEAQHIEMAESSVNEKVESESHHRNSEGETLTPPPEEKGDSVMNSFPHEGDRETHASLTQKVNELQKTLEYLIKNYPLKKLACAPEADNSGFKGLRLSKSKSGRSMLSIPCYLEEDMFTSESVKLTKSLSGKTVLQIPSSWVEKAEEEEKNQHNENEKSGRSVLKGRSSWIKKAEEEANSQHDEHETGGRSFLKIRSSWVEKAENEGKTQQNEDKDEKGGRSVLKGRSSWIKKAEEEANSQSNEDEVRARSFLKIRSSWVEKAEDEGKTQQKEDETGNRSVLKSSSSSVEKTEELQKTQRNDDEKSGRWGMKISSSWEEKAEEEEKSQHNENDTSSGSVLKIPSSCVEKAEENGKNQHTEDEKGFSADSQGRFSRTDSQTSIESDLTDSQIRNVDDDDKTTVLDFEHGPNGVPRYMRENDQSDDSRASNASWIIEFERKRRQIIELWDACYVPLVHRSCFFLLFKGDASDSVYMEVEIRRLYFLQGTLSETKDSRSFTLDSSVRALSREREMLSKQIHKMCSRKEREALYKRWGIDLQTKQRSRQLTQRLWRDSRDFNHIGESAKLVARLVGFLDGDQAPKEIFGLSVSPSVTGNSMLGRVASGKSGISFRWRSSTSSLG